MNLRRVLLSVLAISCAALPVSGWAQTFLDPAKRVYEPSTLFPIVPDHTLVGAPDGAISTEVIKAISDRCLSKVPGRFTPDAHSYYCTCATAATQGTVTIGELQELQKQENRKLGNKTFEKYVRNVMKPCMETPIGDIEYMYCIMYRKNDWRIRYPIPYCGCMSREVSKDFAVDGEAQMMISWGANKNSFVRDPIASLWDNSKFQRSRRNARESCAASYMDPENLK